MAVPSNYSHLKNATGGTFTATTEGGTILGNTTTSAGHITKALSFITNATVSHDRLTLPRVLANGLSGNQKALESSGGTFAYQAAGKYVIARQSTTLSGDSDTNLLFMGQPADAGHIAQFRQSYGAKTVTAFRYGRFTHTGTLVTGATNASRHNWLAAGGASVSTPAALNENMWGIVGGAAVSWTAGLFGIPTRSIPGELVMKADFVTTGVASGGDFFDYKAITGM